MLEIKQQAIKYLSYREYGADELCLKLNSRFINTIVIRDAIEQLQLEGLQSDLRFSESYIQSRVNRGYGRYYIENMLKLKGIAKDDIKRAFDECEIDWSEVIYRVWQKKFSDCFPNNASEKSKQTRFLLSRGFSSQQIIDVFKGLLDETYIAS